MEQRERLAEETVGTAEMMRRRAAELVKVAEACESEAREVEESAARMRARADHLRGLAVEYTGAAAMIERNADASTP